jgi:hypothetical protein
MATKVDKGESPEIPRDDRRPGAPPDPMKRPVGDRPAHEREGDPKPLGNGGIDDPPAYPPHP